MLFKKYLSSSLQLVNKECRSDFDLNKNIDLNLDKKYKIAAVLIPILKTIDGYYIIFTKRKEGLRHHPGQISFPGGRSEKDDKSLQETAIRESYEEIGLQSKNIDILGRVNNYFTGTGFRITPYVAFINNSFNAKINYDEVDEIFRVPLSFLLDSSNHKKGYKLFNEQKIYYHFISYNNYYIWGATAGILINLYQSLKR